MEDDAGEVEAPFTGYGFHVSTSQEPSENVFGKDVEADVGSGYYTTCIFDVLGGKNRKAGGR